MCHSNSQDVTLGLTAAALAAAAASAAPGRGGLGNQLPDLEDCSTVGTIEDCSTVGTIKQTPSHLLSRWRQHLAERHDLVVEAHQRAAEVRQAGQPGRLVAGRPLLLLLLQAAAAAAAAGCGVCCCSVVETRLDGEQGDEIVVLILQ